MNFINRLLFVCLPKASSRFQIFLFQNILTKLLHLIAKLDDKPANFFTIMPHCRSPCRSVRSTIIVVCKTTFCIYHLVKSWNDLCNSSMSDTSTFLVEFVQNWDIDCFFFGPLGQQFPQFDSPVLNPGKILDVNTVCLFIRGNAGHPLKTAWLRFQ